MEWCFARGHLDLGGTLSAPKVAGILNVTPDSFSDGDVKLVDERRDALVARIGGLERWVDAGVSVLDIGAESTRPGASIVSLDEELRRLLPAIALIRDWQGMGGARRQQMILSVDTRHGEVAKEALASGVDVINDVSGGADASLLEHVARHRAGLVLGHLRGVPATMMEEIDFADVVAEVSAELGDSVERALAAGVRREAIVVDPCLGFGKDAAQSRRLLVASAAIETALRCPVMIGASRKRFLSPAGGDLAHERDDATHWAGIIALETGARLLRVHDAVRACQSVVLWSAIRDATA